MRYLENDMVQDGWIVAAACKDECTRHLPLKGKTWFQRMGSKEIANLKFRQGFAFIGVYGRNECTEERSILRKDRVFTQKTFRLKCNDDTEMLDA